ncbi:MAG TPA: mechanosensitive ion channel domain-containing protein [Burkholderiaceae bacterium]|nr:mechanosensitive ion channel domain-containing protein [Burkholderiaceae bacterium]
MNNEPLIRELYTAVSEGLVRPQHAWTAAVVVVALATGWIVASGMRQRVERHHAAHKDAGNRPSEALRVSLGGLRRLAFPVIVLGVLLAGKVVLHALGVFKSAGDERLLQLAMTLVAAMAAIRLVVYILRGAFRQVPMLANFERGIAFLVWLVVALRLGGALTDVVDWLETTTLQIGKTPVSLWTVLMGLASLGVTVLVALWLGSVIEGRLLKSRLDSNLRVVLARVTRALLLLLAVLIGLSAVGMDLTVLSVFGGALGVGLGFGLQRIASNYVSGFVLLLERSLRLGDMIAVDRYQGVVAEINTRYTVLRALDGTEAILPNEMLVSTPVTNFTYSDRRSRVAIKVSVAYDTDLKKAMALLVEAAAAHPRALKDPAVAAGITGFGADGIDLEVGLWISDPEQGKGNIQTEVSQRILEQFRAADIEIPYPQREIRVTQVNPPPSPGD